MNNRSPGRSAIPVLAALLCSAFFGQAASASPDECSRRVLIDLGTLGGASSEALALNDKGQVVGRSQDSSGLGHAFISDGQTMIDIGATVPVAPGIATSATAINRDGQVLVIPDFGLPGPWKYEAGVLTDLRALGMGRPQYINNNGLIIGVRNNIDFTSDAAVIERDGSLNDIGQLNFFQGFGIIKGVTRRGDFVSIYGRYAAQSKLWLRQPDGSYVQKALMQSGWATSTAVSDNRRVVGYRPTPGHSYGGPYFQAFVQDNGSEEGQLLGSLFGDADNVASQAFDISRSGQLIAGVSYSASFQPHPEQATLYTRKQGRFEMSALRPFDSAWSRATLVNDRGDVVGTYGSVVYGAASGFSWKNGHYVDLAALSTTIVDVQPVALNEKGQIAATGMLNGQKRALRIDCVAAP